jgi:hypothetical protein
VIVVGDPATNAGVAPVDATAGLKVDLGGDNDVTVSGTVTANLAAGTNNIGDVDVLSIAAGDNNIGNVDIVTINSVAPAFGSGANGATVQRVTIATDDTVAVDLGTLADNVVALGQTTGSASVPMVPASDWAPSASAGYSIYNDTNCEETKVEIKDTGGVIYKIRATNFATSPRYIKLWNLDSDDVTVGTTAATDHIILPAAAASDCVVVTEAFGTHGVYFNTGITIACTTSLTGSGAPTDGDVVVTVYYK